MAIRAIKDVNVIALLWNSPLCGEHRYGCALVCSLPRKIKQPQTPGFNTPAQSDVQALDYGRSDVSVSFERPMASRM
jgi:hypothetical protein